LVWPRFPLTSTFLNDDRFTIHPLPFLDVQWYFKTLFPHSQENKLPRSNF
jgi:hypothetical protein